jgi:hypothetical protein
MESYQHATQQKPAAAICGNARFACALALVAAGIAVGCQSHALETAEVHGKVTLDGAPVKTGTVMFVPSSGRAGHGVIAPTEPLTSRPTPTATAL